MNYFLVALYFFTGLIVYGSESMNPTVPGFQVVDKDEQASDRFDLYYDIVTLKPEEQLVLKFGKIPSSEDKLNKPLWNVNTRSLEASKAASKQLHAECVMYEAQATRDAYNNIKSLSPSVVKALRSDRPKFSFSSYGHYGHLVVTNQSNEERKYEIVACKASSVNLIKHHKAFIKSSKQPFQPLKNKSDR